MSRLERIFIMVSRRDFLITAGSAGTFLSTGPLLERDEITSAHILHF
jgi:hypothetical protein